VLAVVAALLALPEEATNERACGVLWRSPAPDDPIDLAVGHCARGRWLATTGGISAVAALRVLCEPAIAAHLLTQRSRVAPAHRSQPDELDPFDRLAHHILSDADGMRRLVTARTPAARRRLANRLAREAVSVHPGSRRIINAKAIPA
jgi:hypothetical protein